jgi:nucleoside-diphosphate-sugar epimerase
MKKLLIIGIDSFTGQHLKSYLTSNGYEVYGTAYSESNSKVYKCDITKKDEIKSVIQNILPEYIINLAAISFVATEDKEVFYKDVAAKKQNYPVFVKPVRGSASIAKILSIRR